ncbi:hypothetical protein BBJ28_00024653, partial [Nothophytophthora sp. Chile5]
DVVLATLHSFAARVSVFRLLDEHFLRALLTCLQYVVCSEGEEVVTKGDVDRSMYFIAQGRVLIKLDSSEATRERGEFFGELALLYGMSRLETCVALTVAELYRLDHEPYERLLLDFPKYRTRNKVSWTTSAPTRSALDMALRNFKRRGPTAPVVMDARSPRGESPRNVGDLGTTNERIEAELPHSFVYRSSMAMLAKLHAVDPLEAKDIVLKSRTGARKQLKTQFGLDETPTNVEPVMAGPGTDDVEGESSAAYAHEAVHSFRSLTASPTLPDDDERRDHVTMETKVPLLDRISSVSSISSISSWALAERARSGALEANTHGHAGR